MGNACDLGWNPQFLDPYHSERHIESSFWFGIVELFSYSARGDCDYGD